MIICDLKNDKDLKRNMWIKLGEEAVEGISEIRVFTLFFLMVDYLSSIHKGIHTTMAHTQILYHIPGGLSYTRFFSLFWQPNYSFLGNTSSVKVLHSLQFMVQRYFFLPSHLAYTPSLSSHVPGRFLPCLQLVLPFQPGMNSSLLWGTCLIIPMLLLHHDPSYAVFVYPAVLPYCLPSSLDSEVLL